MTNKDTIEWLMVVKDKFIPKDDDWYDEKYREAIDKAIKALEQEPKETWSIKDVATTFERHGLMTEQESCEDAISKEFIEIVVSYPPADLCVYTEYKGKPYYSIKYRENGKEYYTGFGTYDIKILSQWIKDYFITGIQPKTGHWITQWNVVHQKEYYYCSECREEFSYDGETGIKMNDYNFCPACGAKMESEDKE